MDRRFVAFVVVGSLFLSAFAAAADRAVTLDVRVDVAARRVEGRAVWTLRNDGPASVDVLPLSLYANRFATPPAWLSGLTWYRVFPGGFDAGWTRLGAVTVDGVTVSVPAPGSPPATRLDLPLPAPLEPGKALELALDFETRVPQRLGPFGAVGDVVTLEAGWYPVPLVPGVPADDGAPPPEADAVVRVACAESADAVVGGAYRRCSPGRPGRAVRLAGAAAVALQVREGAARLHNDVGGTTVDLVYDPPRHAAPVAALDDGGGRDPMTGAPAWPRLPDLGWLDREGEIVRTASDAVRFLRERSPELAARLLPGHLRMVEAPLRRDLALPGAGVVWVSDRLLRLTPVERFRKFHRFALVRALYAQFARDAFHDREALADRAWVADVVAEHLTRAFVVARYGVREDAFDVLAPGAFLSVVDNVLYAPQMPFQTAYFNVVDDTDPARDRFELGFGERPTGRRLYEKLRDRLGPEALAALVQAYLGGEGPLRGTPGAPPAAFFEGWLGVYPASNVRLVGIASRPAEGGGGRFEHAALLVREGPAPPPEPVTVRFSLADGRSEDVVWDAPAGCGEGEVTLRADVPLASVELDPEGRLVQWLPGVADDLRVDDRSGIDVKVLLGRVFLTTTPTSGEFSAEAEILFQRRFDIRHTFGLLPFVVPGRAGAAVFHSLGFGPRVTANRLAAFLSSSLRAAGVQTDAGGWRAGLVAQVAVGWSDLVTPLEMLEQDFAFVAARYVLGPDTSKTLHGGQLSAEGAFVRSVHPRHRFGWRFSLGTTVGDIVSGERFQLGGAGGVRAIAASERPGRHLVSTAFEYRHTWTRSLSVSVARLTWWEGIEGVLFVDAGVVGDRYADLVSLDALALGVGYGLRFHAALFGVQPSMLSIDVAWPVPTASWVTERTGPPVSLQVYFTQNF